MPKFYTLPPVFILSIYILVIGFGCIIWKMKLDNNKRIIEKNIFFYLIVSLANFIQYHFLTETVALACAVGIITISFMVTFAGREAVQYTVSAISFGDNGVIP